MKKSKPQSFRPDHFVGGSFWTADQKAKVANDFVRFFSDGCPEWRFTKNLYRALSSMWGNCAEYDRAGFYGTWFSTPSRTYDFLANCLSYWMGGQGDPACSLSDVERVLTSWIRQEGLTAAYLQRVLEEREACEREQLATLKAKYEGDPPAKESEGLGLEW